MLHSAPSNVFILLSFVVHDVRISAFLLQVKKMNDAGTHFPLWGTCQGFQLLHLLAANDDLSVLEINAYDSEGALRLPYASHTSSDCFPRGGGSLHVIMSYDRVLPAFVFPSSVSFVSFFSDLRLTFTPCVHAHFFFFYFLSFFLSPDYYIPLNFSSYAVSSRMLGNVPGTKEPNEVRVILGTLPSTTNLHHNGVPSTAYTAVRVPPSVLEIAWQPTSSLRAANVNCFES